MHVLVVDDESSIRDLLEIHFVSEGYKVSTAESADRANDILLMDNSVNYVISDIRMPGKIDGLGLVKNWKNKNSNSLKFILFSGYNDYSTEELKLAGVDAFLLKPVDIFELLEVVKKLQ